MTVGRVSGVAPAITTLLPEPYMPWLKQSTLAYSPVNILPVASYVTTSRVESITVPALWLYVILFPAVNSSAWIFVRNKVSNPPREAIPSLTPEPEPLISAVTIPTRSPTWYPEPVADTAAPVIGDAPVPTVTEWSVKPAPFPVIE